MHYYSIALDGPAGSGKSTLARVLAKKLGYLYVDTGALYRAIALYCLRENITTEEREKLSAACDQIEITLTYEEQEQQVWLNGENVTGKIRTEEVSRRTSEISGVEKVREKLLSLQRELAKKTNVVMDGRDIGTHVLPYADLKIFLTADVSERAKRRQLELQQKGELHTLEEIQEEMIERDAKDSQRLIAPLKRAEDAILLDTTNLSKEEVLEELVRLQKEMLAL